MSRHGAYRENHYVPQWYQRRFSSENPSDRMLQVLSFEPKQYLGKDGLIRFDPAESRKPHKHCFVERDLYTTNVQGINNTEIEQYFFGDIDNSGKKAVSAFADSEGEGLILGKHFNNLIVYLCTQKLRTPKGLAWLADNTTTRGKTQLLILLQRFKQVFGAIWAECIWQIADASLSATKFIISDHPITVYNRECPPESAHCLSWNDPDIRFSGTHTLFPLSAEKILILTNLSWIRNPYGSAIEPRSNPSLHRDTIFKALEMQSRRLLTEEEVLQINLIIKKRANKYVAATKSDWLYPERHIDARKWGEFGNGYLLMPDPREVSFSRQMYVGYKDGSSFAIDEYGRTPINQDYANQDKADNEWKSFNRFRSDFARMQGRKKRGRNLKRFNDLGTDSDEYSEDYHQSMISQST